jgi:hypothetical protein
VHSPKSSKVPRSRDVWMQSGPRTSKYSGKAAPDDGPYRTVVRTLRNSVAKC